MRAAVLTGDLIGSTKAGPSATDAAIQAIREAAETAQTWTNAPVRFERYRGDGWQMLLSEPKFALRLSLMITAKLVASRTGLLSRIAIDVNEIDDIRARTLAEESAEAFVKSGKALDDLPDATPIVLAGHKIPRMAFAALLMADKVARDWTPEQAEAIALALSPQKPTIREIAETLGISSAAAGYRLTGAYYREMRNVAEAFEQDQKDWKE